MDTFTYNGINHVVLSRSIIAKCGVYCVEKFWIRGHHAIPNSIRIQGYSGPETEIEQTILKPAHQFEVTKEKK